jgi:sugar lactone lactonase YvrE
MRRIARVLVLGALVVGLVGVIGGAQVASAQTGPIGYSVGDDEGPNECDFFSIDLPTGVYTQISDESLDILCADGLTFSPDGTLYAYVNQQSAGAFSTTLVTIDLATGAQTTVGLLPTVAVGSGGMTFDAAGDLWLYATAPIGGDPDCGLNGPQACLWRVDPADASTEFVGAGLVDDRAVFGLTGSCDAGVLAISASIPNGAGSDATVDRVDTTTAGVEEVVATPGIFLPEGLDFDAAGELWAISVLPFGGIGQFEVNNIDLATGDVTETPIVDSGGDQFGGFLLGLAVSPATPCPAPTPEPIVLEPTFTG